MAENKKIIAPIETTKNSERFLGDGINKKFPINFPYIEDKDIIVTIRASDGVDSVLKQGIDYNLADDNVCFFEPPGLVVKIGFERKTSLTQTTKFEDGDIAPANSFNFGYNKLTLTVQENHRDIVRSVKISLFDDGDPKAIITQIIKEANYLLNVQNK